MKYKDFGFGLPLQSDQLHAAHVPLSQTSASVYSAAPAGPPGNTSGSAYLHHPSQKFAASQQYQVSTMRKT